MFNGQKIFFLSLCFLHLSTAAAQDSCTNSTLDWQQLSVFPSFPQTLGSHTLDLTIDDPSGSAPIFTPINTNFYSANGDASEYGIYARLQRLGTQSLTVNLAVSGEPAMLDFQLYDVDGQNDPKFFRQEVYRISASYQGNAVNPVFTTTAQMQVTGNVVRGYEEVKPTPTGDGDLAPAEGILAVSFEAPVDSVQIEFSIDAAQLTVSRPGFALGNINIVCAAQSITQDVASPRAVPVSNWLTLIGLMFVVGASVIYYRRRVYWQNWRGLLG